MEDAIHKEYVEVHEKIKEILNACEGGEYVFRGEKEFYNNISSGLYRYFCEPSVGRRKPLIDPERFSVLWEEEFVQRAKQHFQNTSSVGILTELQHYGGKTTLIDFTYNFHVALFFACDGGFGKDGRIILLNQSRLTEVEGDIDYNKNSDYIFVTPIGKNTRVIFQSSIFVHAPKGLIDEKELKEDLKIITIKKEIKRDMLDYLKKRLGIHAETIYNDIHGFIQNTENYSMPAIEFFIGLECMQNGNYKNAIKHFTKCADLVSGVKLAAAYTYKANARRMLKQYQSALKDVNCAIGEYPTYVFAYRVRSAIYDEMGDISKAIDDYEYSKKLNEQQNSDNVAQSAK